MLDQKLLKELAEKFFNNFTASSDELTKSKLANTFKLVVDQSVENLELVTRQQFDIQAKVLASAQEQLELLNLKIAKLEALKKT
jgi:BMFP domain-containing protein YqiC